MNWIDGPKNIALLSALLALCILAESTVLQRFSSPVIDLAAEAMSALAVAPSKQQSVSTTIVQISHRDGENMDSLWPLSFEIYERFLIRVWCLGARAVFVDISFFDHGNTLAENVALQRLASTVQLLSGDDDNTSRERNEVWQERCDGLPAGVAESPIKEGMPIFFARPIGTLAYDRLGAQSVANRVGYSDGIHVYKDRYDGLPTAAFALVRELCRRGLIQSRPCDRLRTLRPEYAFEVQDTLITPPEQYNFTTANRYSTSRCIYRDDWSADNLSAVVHRLLQHMKGTTTRDWFGCPPVLTVPFHQTNEPAQLISVADAVRDHVVLLGSSVPGNPDITSTRFHSEIPGVYLHALAIDALLSSIGPVELSSDVKQRALLIFLCSLVVVTCHAFLRLSYDTRASVPSGALPGQTFLRILVVVGMSAVLFYLYLFFRRWNLSIALTESLCFLMSNNIDPKWADPIRFFGGQLDILRDRFQEKRQ